MGKRFGENITATPPSIAYAGLALRRHRLDVGILNGSFSHRRTPVISSSSLPRVLDRDSHRTNTRVVAAGISGLNGSSLRVGSTLWRDYDVVPIFLPLTTPTVDAHSLAQRASDQFTPEGIPIVQFGLHNEVIPSQLVALDAYKQADPEPFAEAAFFADKLKGKKIVHLSSTPQGGGVALMRHAEIRLAQQMGVDMHWHVMTADDPRVFDITKRKFHNTFQDVAPHDGANELTAQDREIYQGWIARNAQTLRPAYQHADVVIIDDYQPSGLIPYILDANPKAKIIYRSHIQIVGSLTNDPATVQSRNWNYLWYGDPDQKRENNGIQAAHMFVSHPMPEFVPGIVPMGRVVAMGATTDRFDGLNKPLNTEQMHYYLDYVDRKLVEQGQTPIDHTRPYIAQIARFDPSKGIPHLLESFRLARAKIVLHNSQHPNNKIQIPQLVIAGHGAIDDPEGNKVYSQTRELVQGLPADIAADIKVVQLPHLDQPLNALMRGAKFATQLSTREGFEIKVTEALMKGKPIIASNRGGIPLQVVDGQSGFIVEPTDYQIIADHMITLLADERAYRRMSKQAYKLANPDFTTTQNLANWLYLSTQVLETDCPITNGNFANVPDVVRARYRESQVRRAGTRRLLPPQVQASF